MILVLGALAAVPLFLFARRGERDGNPERFVAFVVGVLLVECLLYPAQSETPVGPFRIPFLGGNVRTHDALVAIGVVARASVRRLPHRISRTGMWWLLAAVWLFTAALRGLLVGHPMNIVMFSTMSLVGMFGAMLLVAGCDPSRLIAMLRGRFVVVLAVVVLVLIPNTWDGAGDPFFLGFGVVHVDTASVFVGLATFVILVEWSADRPNRWAAWAAVPLLASAVVLQQRATLVHLGATVLVVGWAMTRAQWRSHIRVPRIRLLWGALSVVAGLMVVLMVQLVTGEGSLPFADYYEGTFSTRGQQLSAQARVEAFDVGVEEWQAAPLYGHGLGHTYEIIRPGGVGLRRPATFDNVPLDLVVRSGAIGLGLLAIALTASVRDGLRVWRRHPRSTVSALALAAVAVLVGLAFKSLFESILEKGKLTLVLGLSAGVIAATMREAAHWQRGHQREAEPEPSGGA